jgi:hypothetical protein
MRGRIENNIEEEHTTANTTKQPTAANNEGFNATATNQTSPHSPHPNQNL